MAPASAVDPGTAQALRAKIEALAGVEHAAVDETNLRVLIHCEPDCNESELRARVQNVIDAAGVDAKGATVHLLTDLAARRRVKFSNVERIVEHNNVRIRVSLEWHGESFHGESVGENGEMIEQRTAASAAIVALEKVLQEPLGVRLIGVKQVKAFDAELMVVALISSGDKPQRLVGSVSVGGNPRRAAAVAVLNALNRVLGNYLSVRE